MKAAGTDMSEPRHIHVMPPDLAQKIAAGEVVERPASVVKELIDNAIDAGAHSVKVEIRDAGLQMIRVTDDGAGILREDLPLVFTPHATSKIRNFGDLERLGTLGFRGEALPSIGAVSRVEIVTRAAQEYVGSRYCFEHGDEREARGSGAPLGTQITVLGLFSNVPARRTFVRSLRAEAGQIGTVVAQYALAQPTVRFSFTVDGRTALESPGTGSIEDAVLAVYGAGVADMMVPVAFDAPGVDVSGLTSKPKLTRQNRTGIHLFVNGRPVANRGLGFSLEEAYSGFLMTGRHPLAVLHLDIVAHEVDVNVHPSKNEVRFAREREVHRAVHRSVAQALLELRSDSGSPAPNFEPGATAFSPATALTLLPSDEPGDLGNVDLGVPALRIFGQANQTFIIAEGPNGLYMIDQHAAHERILFDRFDEQLLQGAIPSQPLLEPASLQLTPAQMQALEESVDLLIDLGFALESFGNTTCLVRALPSTVNGTAPLVAAVEVLEELSVSLDPAAARDRALASLACRAAVKAGQTLDVQEMRQIVIQLERTPRPSTCPHGRPTMIHLSNTQLERQFGRR